LKANKNPLRLERGISAGSFYSPLVFQAGTSCGSFTSIGSCVCVGTKV
jgi:hypothetical protein